MPTDCSVRLPVCPRLHPIAYRCRHPTAESSLHAVSFPSSIVLIGQELGFGEEAAASRVVACPGDGTASVASPSEAAPLCLSLPHVCMKRGMSSHNLMLVCRRKAKKSLASDPAAPDFQLNGERGPACQCCEQCSSSFLVPPLLSSRCRRKERVSSGSRERPWRPRKEPKFGRWTILRKHTSSGDAYDNKQWLLYRARTRHPEQCHTLRILSKSQAFGPSARPRDMYSRGAC